MALKIDASNSAVAHHIVDGAVLFPYAIDAHHAVTHFPNEWSEMPWSAADMAAARSEAGAPELELSPEDQAAIDEHAKAVAEANERLKARREKAAAERAEAEQVAADEAIIASAPPRPAPKVAQPLSMAQRRKRAAETDEERVAREQGEAAAAKKANEDKLAETSAKGAPITG